MHVDAVQRHFELREGVEPRLLRAPIEARAPVVEQAAQILDIGAVGPGVAGCLIGNRVRASRSRRSAMASSAIFGAKASGCAFFLRPPLPA
jgi:hypothetical protein